MKAILMFMVWICLFSIPLKADDTEVNIPVRTAELKGRWLLKVKEGQFQQRLDLGSGRNGSWLKIPKTKPTTITWFVEGNELIFMTYQPNKSSRYPYQWKGYPTQRPGDVLIIYDGDRKLIFERNKSLKIIRPENGVLEVTSNKSHVTFVILKAENKEVVKIIYQPDNGFWTQLKSGLYILHVYKHGYLSLTKKVELLKEKKLHIHAMLGKTKSHFRSPQPNEKSGEIR